MKTSIYLALVCYFLIGRNVFAQNLEWVRAMGAGVNDVGYSVKTDEFGNVYTTGYFQGAVDFDPGPGIFILAAAGWSDVFISKLDSQGNFLWAKQLGGREIDYGTSITLDLSGNIYLTGFFAGEADFDPGTGIYNLKCTGVYDVFVSKLDRNGNFIWAKNMGGNSWHEANAIAVDGLGNIYTTGFYRGPGDYDPGPGIFNLQSAGDDDVFISKLDSNGNFLWAKSIAGSRRELAFAIAVDGLGNVYSTGMFSNTADFDPGSGIFNMTAQKSGGAAYISKLDANGNFVWAKQLGGSEVDNSWGTSIVLDSSGNIYSSGYFSGSADFDPGTGVFTLTSGLYADGYISKLNSYGNFVLAKQIAGTSGVYPSSIAVDKSRSIYTTGSFYGKVDLDPGIDMFNLSANFEEAYISKFDSSGNFVWASALNGERSDNGRSITVDAFERVYVTGVFADEADLDPGAGVQSYTSAGGWDAFILKLDNCSNSISSITSGNHCKEGSVTLEANSSSDSLVWYSSGNPGDTITSGSRFTTPILSATTTYYVQALGKACNSPLVPVVAMITYVNDSIYSINSVLYAAEFGAGYQWINCKDSLPIIGATGAGFIPKGNGRYAVIITKNGCVDTSDCIDFVLLSSVASVAKDKILVYPNPGEGVYTIEASTDLRNSNMEIKNMLGEIVASTVITSTGPIVFDIPGPTGIYFVTIRKDDQQDLNLMVIKK